MQRLTSWFDQLPLRRQSKNSKNGKNNSKTSSSSLSSSSGQRNKPKLRYSVSAAHQFRRDHPQQQHPIGCGGGDYEQRQLRSPFDHTGPATDLTTSWCSQEVTDGRSSGRSQQFNTLPTNIRPKIRTNPWYSQMDHRASLRGPPRPPTNLYASVQTAPRPKRASLLGVVSSLDDSTCSSGYGSQDSSPESSVHSPDWHPSPSSSSSSSASDKHSDKAVDCKSIDVDEALGLDDRFEEEDDEVIEVGGDDDDDDDDDDYDPTGDFCDVCYEQEAICDENGNSGRNHYHHHHHHLKPPTFHAPPPPLTAEDGEGDDKEFLAELTAKIEALRWKSEQVRSLISRARAERDQRLRDKQTCLEQITALRQMKWVVRNNFELIL